MYLFLNHRTFNVYFRYFATTTYYMPFSPQSVFIHTWVHVVSFYLSLLMGTTYTFARIQDWRSFNNTRISSNRVLPLSNMCLLCCICHFVTMVITFFSLIHLFSYFYLSPLLYSMLIGKGPRSFNITTQSIRPISVKFSFHRFATKISTCHLAYPFNHMWTAFLLMSCSRFANHFWTSVHIMSFSSSAQLMKLYVDFVLSISRSANIC